jgi:hypothetical protein
MALFLVSPLASWPKLIWKVDHRLLVRATEGDACAQLVRFLVTDGNS